MGLMDGCIADALEHIRISDRPIDGKNRWSCGIKAGSNFEKKTGKTYRWEKDGMFKEGKHSDLVSFFDDCVVWNKFPCMKDGWKVTITKERSEELQVYTCYKKGIEDVLFKGKINEIAAHFDVDVALIRNGEWVKGVKTIGDLMLCTKAGEVKKLRVPIKDLTYFRIEGFEGLYQAVIIEKLTGTNRCVVQKMAKNCDGFFNVRGYKIERVIVKGTWYANDKDQVEKFNSENKGYKLSY